MKIFVTDICECNNHLFIFLIIANYQNYQIILFFYYYKKKIADTKTIFRIIFHVVYLLHSTNELIL